MGLVALLAGLVVIIVILGFITSLQNRFAKPERGRRRSSFSFEDESDGAQEERHSSRYHHRKSTAPQRHHEDAHAHHSESDKIHRHQTNSYAEHHRHTSESRRHE